MKYSSVLLSAIFLFITVQACGNVSADSIPQMLPNEVITGITVTSADNMILGEIDDPSHGGDAEGEQITCTNGTGIIADQYSSPNIHNGIRFSVPTSRLSAATSGCVPSFTIGTGSDLSPTAIVIPFRYKAPFLCTEQLNPAF